MLNVSTYNNEQKYLHRSAFPTKFPVNLCIKYTQPFLQNIHITFDFKIKISYETMNRLHNCFGTDY